MEKGLNAINKWSSKPLYSLFFTSLIHAEYFKYCKKQKALMRVWFCRAWDCCSSILLTSVIYKSRRRARTERYGHFLHFSDLVAHLMRITNDGRSWDSFWQCLVQVTSECSTTDLECAILTECSNGENCIKNIIVDYLKSKLHSNWLV